jgi:hypothetical protein
LLLVTQSKEARAIPTSAGNREGDFGEASVRCPVPREPVGHYYDPLWLIVPFTHQDRAWRQLNLLPVERNEFDNDSRTVVFSSDLVQKLSRATIKVT